MLKPGTCFQIVVHSSRDWQQILRNTAARVDAIYAEPKKEIAPKNQGEKKASSRDR
jgi:hypothetical protein